jgi:WD40 repeat protein
MFPKANGLGIQSMGRSFFFDARGRLWALSRVGASLMSLIDGPLRQMPGSPTNGQFWQVAASPDGRLVAVIRNDEDAALLVWDLEADEVRSLESSKGTVFWALTFLADGTLVSGDGSGNVLRWNLQDGTSTLIAKSPLPFIANLAPSRDPRFLLVTAWASVSLDENTIGTLSILDMHTRTFQTITSRGERVTAAALDSTTSLLVTTDGDGTVQVGSSQTDESHLFLVPKPINSWISPDGQWILVDFFPDDFALTVELKSALCLLRKPEGRPLHTLPREELLQHLRGLTNLRAVPDQTSRTGYRVDAEAFPGWGKIAFQ